jgi:hypothetical protein
VRAVGGLTVVRQLIFYDCIKLATESTEEYHVLRCVGLGTTTCSASAEFVG